MHRAGRAGQVVDLIHLHIQREGDVVPHQLEARVAQQVGNVVPPPGEIVVHAQHFVATRQQRIAEV